MFNYGSRGFSKKMNFLSMFVLVMRIYGLDPFDGKHGFAAVKLIAADLTFNGDSLSFLISMENVWQKKFMFLNAADSDVR